MSFIKNYILTLNLFRPPQDAEPENNHQYRNNIISTRIYLILLSTILVALIIATSLSSQVTNVTIFNPTQIQFESLPTDSVCPCSQSSIFYNEFISNQPTFHQICSSQFISEEWIQAFYFGINTTYFIAVDFRATAVGQWQVLARFCQLVQTYVLQNIIQFSSTSFISANLLSKSLLETQVNTYLNQFQQSTLNTFQTQVQLVREMFAGDEFMSGLETSFFPTIFPTDTGPQILYSVNIFQQEDDSWCLCLGSTTCRGASGFYDDFDFETGGYLWRNISARMIMPGFVTGCMPVDSLLQSTLECLFNQTCVNDIVSYSQNPEKIFTAMTTQPTTQFDINATVESIINQLMVEDWANNISFDKYYTACAPFSCTYSLNKRHDFLYVLSTLIGLLGGLCAGLSIIVPLVVNFIRRPPHNEPTSRISLMERLHHFGTKFKGIFIELNLFEVYPRDERQIRHQRIATRMYIIILLSTLIVLVLYSYLVQQVYQRTVKNPSQSEYSNLYSVYPTSLNCPCSSISNTYENFLNVKPTYHEAISSSFGISAWIDYLNAAALANVYFYFLDYRADAVGQFELLVTFYQQAQQTITNSLDQFLQQKYVTSQIISETLFNSQTNTFIEDWKAITIKEYLRTIKLIRLNRAGNQYYAAGYFGNLYVDNSSDIFYQPIIYINDASQSPCNCALDLSCHTQIGIFNYDIYTNNVTELFAVPGLYIGCYPIEALFDSTLECYYNQSCMDTLASYLPPNTTPVNFTILNGSQSEATETIGSMVNRMFIDQWSSNTSFTAYYNACSPVSCTYQYSSGRSVLDLVTIIITIFGGLTTLLKIIIFIILKLVAKIRTNQSFCGHLRLVKNWFFTLHHDQYLVRRLKIFLLIIILIGFFLGSILTKQSKIVQISKPSLSFYNDLSMKYSTILQCPCSQVSIQYGRFINISSVEYHQICSSNFANDEWINAIYNNGSTTLFPSDDYLFTLMTQLRFLNSLCEITQEVLNDALSSFNTTEFVEIYLISPIVFQKKIKSIITQFQNNLPNSFLNTHQLVRKLAAANTLINFFESNWGWNNMKNHLYDYATVHTRPTMYGTCDCALSSQCVQAAILANNQSIPGLFLGCHPVEALLQSTLECFYNSSCIRQLHATNISFIPLNSSLPSRYQINSTITNIINELMFEQWSINIEYETYFDECAPIFCSYSYLGYRSTIDALTTLLGLYGGLVIIMKVVVPVLINIWNAIKDRYRRIHPRPI